MGARGQGAVLAHLLSLGQIMVNGADDSTCSEPAARVQPLFHISGCLPNVACLPRMPSLCGCLGRSLLVLRVLHEHFGD